MQRAGCKQQMRYATWHEHHARCLTSTMTSRSRRWTSQQHAHQPSGTPRHERQSSATTTLCVLAHNCSSSSDLKIGLTLKTQRYAPDKATKREPLQGRSEGTNHPPRRRGQPLRWQGGSDRTHRWHRPAAWHLGQPGGNTRSRQVYSDWVAQPKKEKPRFFQTSACFSIFLLTASCSRKRRSMHLAYHCSNRQYNPYSCRL